MATVRINNMMYGCGCGSSKKTAKMEAAKDTLEILIPQVKGKFKSDDKPAQEERDLSVSEQLNL